MSDTTQMGQELAKRLLEEGSTCIFLGVTPGCEFGIDFKSWNTAEKFLGIKMIPPGFHFIHYSMTNRHGDMAMRSGFIWFTNRSDIIVKKWNEAEEQFQDETEEKGGQIKADLKSIDKQLGPYPYDIWEKWKRLTSKITEQIAKKIVPDSGIISSALNLVPSETERKDLPRKRLSNHAPFSDIDKFNDLLPDLKPAKGTALQFCKVPDTSYPPGSTPSEITKHSLDSSYIFQQLLDQYEKPSDILGELQFAYISFLVGHSMEAFEQWKQLIGIFSSVQDSLPRYSSLFYDLLAILHPQLEDVPQDFLADIVTTNNFIYQSLRKLFRNINSDENLDGRLKSRARRLMESLTKDFMWDFSDIMEDEEDELPVIVET